MKTKRTNPPPTYESVALGVLVYEFTFSDREESNKKIKDRLRRKKLDAFDPKRIEPLRRLKDYLQAEISKGEASRYYVGPTGKARLMVYVELSDFDIPKLTRHAVAKHKSIPKAEIECFVPFCVAVYHLL